MTTSWFDGRTVLVTGGAGFVGSHLVDALVDRCEVRVLDDFSSGSRARVHGDATVVEGSLTDEATLERACRDVDVIFHQAAVVSVTECVDRPVETNATNLDGTLAVFDQARRQDARVVVASSAAVYGHPRTVPLPESAPTAPLSPYGVQKLAADRYATVYASLYDLPAVPLRYFNVYGPGQRGPYSGVITTFLEQARAGDPLTVEGDGEQTRDFVHVADVVRANLLAAARADDVAGEAFNVGTGTATSIRDLAETIRHVTGSDVPIEHGDARAGDVRHSRAAVSNARSRLGFEATVDLMPGLRTLVGDGDRSGGRATLPADAVEPIPEDAAETVSDETVETVTDDAAETAVDGSQ